MAAIEITTNNCIASITTVSECYQVWPDLIDTKGMAAVRGKKMLTEPDLLNEYDAETNTAKDPLTGTKKKMERSKEKFGKSPSFTDQSDKKTNTQSQLKHFALQQLPGKICTTSKQTQREVWKFSKYLFCVNQF
jgi:hypothetical protein